MSCAPWPRLSRRDGPRSPQLPKRVSKFADSEDRLAVFVRFGRPPPFFARRSLLVFLGGARRRRPGPSAIPVAPEGGRLLGSGCRGKQRIFQATDLARRIARNPTCLGLARLAQTPSQFRFDVGEHRLKRIP